MEELAKVVLGNEMDLILAHKRAMKLGELAGLSLASQTTFATAVSEVSRYAMELGAEPVLVLSASTTQRSQSLIAVVKDKQLTVANPLHQGLQYAQRLVEKLEITNTGKESKISLYYKVPGSRRIKPERLSDWRSQFNADLPLSAYDEIKRKNEQLQELSLRLQASEQHYKQVTNSLPLMIFTANQAGQLLYANDWVGAFTGHSIQSLNLTKWTSVIHPDDYTHFWSLWAQQAAQDLAFQCECRLREAASESYLWHLFSVQPVSSESKKVTALTGFVVNINAQKIVGQTLREKEELVQAKTQLEQSQRELESTVNELHRSNARLSQFAYVASHDLQEPLRKIQQFGDLLKTRSTSLASDDLVYLDRMQSAASRMSVLIKDLLSFSSFTTHQHTAVQVYLNPVVDAALENLSVQIADTKAQISVDALPYIQGEVSQLIQLFQNLLSNALKFCRPNVRPTAHISCAEVALTDLPPAIKPVRQSPVYYCINVVDNGIGFDEKYLDRIFQVFQRLHGKNEFAGTGVGLAICEKVVANHGGAITASSEPGKGSTFSIYLPAPTETAQPLKTA